MSLSLLRRLQKAEKNFFFFYVFLYKRHARELHITREEKERVGGARRKMLMCRVATAPKSCFRESFFMVFFNVIEIVEGACGFFFFFVLFIVKDLLISIIFGRCKRLISVFNEIRNQV